MGDGSFPGVDRSANVAAEGLVRLELTGPLRRAAGTQHVTVPCEAQITLGELLDRLRSLCPPIAAHLNPGTTTAGRHSALPPGLLVLRDQQLLPSDPEFAVAAGDQITLMPMISGG